MATDLFDRARQRLSTLREAGVGTTEPVNAPVLADEINEINEIRSGSLSDEELNEINEIRVAGELPANNADAHRIRQRLLRWGGPRLWPALPQTSIDQGGEAWSTWLWAADVDMLASALAEAFCSGIPEGITLGDGKDETGSIGPMQGANEDDESAEPVDGPSYPLPW